MKEITIGTSPPTGTIFAGKILKSGTWGANKQDVTNQAVKAVALHLLTVDEKVIFGIEGKRYELSCNEVEEEK